MSNFINILKNVHTNCLGNSISDKVIVFESDDWGSIRISSKEDQEYLYSFGIDFNEDQYTMYDGLETNEDIDILCETLLRFKNSDGYHPKFTLNTVCANPDFNKIAASNFSTYFYEPITKTYSNYSNSDKVLEKINLGINEKIVYPQFHSREHVNVDLWLSLLNSKDRYFSEAFKRGIFALGSKYTSEYGKHIAATYDTSNVEYVKSSILSGSELFFEIFGYKSITYIPNNYVWNPDWDHFLIDAGILHIQGMKYLLLSKEKVNQKRKILRLYNGKMNKLGQTYSVRNCTFEPLSCSYSLDKTLFEIKSSFLFNKPAIISTHRANFTSRLGPRSRDKSIKELSSLIKYILKKWPNVKFLSSNDYLSYTKD